MEDHGATPAKSSLAPNHDQQSYPRGRLTKSVVSSLDLAAVHRIHEKPVTSLDFNLNGSLLASSSGDNTIGIFDALNGTYKGSIPVRKYGAGVVKWMLDAESPLSIFTTSTIRDNHVKMLDLQTEQYVRYFVGHDSMVTSISASPVGPNLLSASADGWIRLWDVKQEHAIGKVKAYGTPLVAYDPKGLIFGIAYCNFKGKTLVQLYDPKNYQDGPFLEFKIANNSNASPSCFKFSSDGEYLLLVHGDVDSPIEICDAYKGGSYRTFKGQSNGSGIPLEASFSPDSAYVAIGGDDGSYHVWHLESEEMLVSKKNVHALPSGCVLWNPYCQMVATACQNIVFWLPNSDEVLPEY